MPDNWMRDVVPLEGYDAKMFKRPAQDDPVKTNPVWQVQIGSGSGRLFRSLKTKNQTWATNAAIRKIRELRHRREIGLADEATKLDAALADFGRHETLRIRREGKSPQRLDKITRTIANFKKHLVMGQKLQFLDQIGARNLENYVEARFAAAQARGDKGTTTVDQERIIWGTFRTHALKKKWAIDLPEMETPKPSSQPRTPFTLAEWYYLTEDFGPKWVASARGGQFHFELYGRPNTFLYVCILGETGMRPTEAYRLKWGDIIIDKKDTGETPNLLETLSEEEDIRWEGYDTYIYVEGKAKLGEFHAKDKVVKWLQDLYLLHCKTFGEPTLNDYLFRNETTGEPLKYFQGGWRKLMSASKLLLSKDGKQRTINSLRHTYAERRAQEDGWGPGELKDNMRTSDRLIRTVYDKTSQRTKVRAQRERERLRDAGT